MIEYVMHDRCKDPENRSNKVCLCGGHSSKDVKKNLHHNSTKLRYQHKISSIFKLKMRNKEIE